MSQRAQFVQSVSDSMDHDDEVVLVLCDISVFAFRDVKAKHPDRVLNVGVSEQGAVGFAAGLAVDGLYPIVHTIDSFLARRAYEFLRLDFSAQRLPGLFVSVGHDRDYRQLGPSHHCPEGYELLSLIPGLRVCEPETETALNNAIRDSIREREFTYIRMRG